MNIMFYMLVSLVAMRGEIQMASLGYAESINEDEAKSTKGAIGRYQITQACLTDYNNCHKVQYRLVDMYVERHATKVAFWYVNVEIPRVFKRLDIEDTVPNRLMAYSWGMVHVANHEKRPDWFKRYMKRYNRHLCEMV